MTTPHPTETLHLLDVLPVYVSGLLQRIGTTALYVDSGRIVLIDSGISIEDQQAVVDWLIADRAHKALGAYEDARK